MELNATQDSLLKQAEQSRLAQEEMGQLEMSQQTAIQSASVEQNDAEMIAQEAIGELCESVVALSESMASIVPSVRRVSITKKNLNVKTVCEAIQQMCTQISKTKGKKRKKLSGAAAPEQNCTTEELYNELFEHQSNVLRTLQTFMFKTVK